MTLSRDEEALAAATAAKAPLSVPSVPAEEGEGAGREPLAPLLPCFAAALLLLLEGAGGLIGPEEPAAALAAAAAAVAAAEAEASDDDEKKVPRKARFAAVWSVNDAKACAQEAAERKSRKR